MLFNRFCLASMTWRLRWPWSLHSSGRTDTCSDSHPRFQQILFIGPTAWIQLAPPSFSSAALCVLFPSFVSFGCVSRWGFFCSLSSFFFFFFFLSSSIDLCALLLLLLFFFYPTDRPKIGDCWHVTSFGHFSRPFTGLKIQLANLIASQRVTTAGGGWCCWWPICYQSPC